MSKKAKRCLGWPVGTACAKPPGTKWGPHWCEDCNKQRLEHIDKQMNKLAESFSLSPTSRR
jgi:hypothetical protein